LRSSKTFSIRMRGHLRGDARFLQHFLTCSQVYGMSNAISLAVAVRDHI